MDINQTQQPIAVNQPTQPPIQSVQPASPPAVPQPTHKGFLIGGIIFILVLTAVLFYLATQQKPSAPETAKVQPVVETKPTLSPTPSPTEGKEIQTVDTADPTSDLQDVQNDLGQL